MGVKSLTGEDIGALQVPEKRDLLLERLMSRTFLTQYMKQELKIDVQFIRAVCYSKHDKRNFIFCTIII